MLRAILEDTLELIALGAFIALILVIAIAIGG
jgi:hypothetical protein